MIWERYQNSDRETVVSFLKKADQETDLALSTLPGGLEKSIDDLNQNGKILVAQNKSTPIGFLGYFRGEPKKKFENPSIGYIYLLVTDQKYKQNPSIGRNLLRKLVQEMLEDHITEIRFKAHKDSKVNSLYQKIATKKDEEENAQGIPSILYSTPIESWIRFCK